MNEESQRTVASSLLTSMELVTNAMLNSFEEPVVEKIVEDNMGICHTMYILQHLATYKSCIL